MKKQPPSLFNVSDNLKIIEDRSGVLALKAYHRLNEKLDINQVVFSWGFVYNGRLIGILVWTDMRPAHDAWWTIVTWDKHWCTKKVLNFLFTVAKNVYHLERINALVKCQNQPAVRLLERLNFKKEGHLKRYFSDRSDAFLFAKYL